MILRRPQILADGKYVYSAGTQIAENINQFRSRFAEADHDAALGDHVGIPLLRVREQVERALVARSGTDHPIQPRY